MGWFDFCIEDNTLIRYDRVLTKYIGNDEHVIGPDDVLVIGEDALFENNTVKRITLPSKLKRIQARAF